MASRIELLKLVSRGSPTKAIVSVASEATVRHRDGHSQAGRHEHVSDAMENEKALSDHLEWPGGKISPTDTGAIE